MWERRVTPRRKLPLSTQSGSTRATFDGALSPLGAWTAKRLHVLMHDGMRHMHMIIDIPKPSDFHAAGLSQLHLAWKIVMQAVHDFDNATYYKLAEETPEEAAAEYWRRSQSSLANAFTLVQQGMELALKGRIATVSPFLLIGDPGDWPVRAATENVSFGEFRTLDAVSLVKVHNAVSAAPFDEDFSEFWTQVRNDRNKLMHSPAPGYFDPPRVVRTLLKAIHALFADEPWPRRLLKLEYESKYAALGDNDEAVNIVMRELDDALKYLEPSEALKFLGFDKKRRAYVCPHCYAAANRDWQDEWPRLAQFTQKKPGWTELNCVLCERITEVERLSCGNQGCPSDVAYGGMCLVCTRG